MSRTVWTWARLAGAAVTFAVLVWRLGTGPFLDGVRTVDGRALAAAAGLAVLTTVCCAWRWKIVARGLGVDLPLPAAVAAYYRSLFLNVTLPGGVVGDVHRGVSHGRDVERCRPRAAGRRVGALRRAGRAGRPDRRRAARAAVARALVHAAGRDRGRRGGARRRARGSGAARRRSVPVGAGPSAAAGDIRDGLLARTGVAGHRARVRAGRRRPRGHLPDRRADRGHHRAAVPDAAAGAARAAGHGAAQRRRLGAARGRDRMGVRRGRPGRGAGGRHRRRLRRHGARRQPAGCRRPGGGVVPSYPAPASEPRARGGSGRVRPDGAARA